ncbi:MULTISPECIES: DsrE family protein [Micrococcaceae]|uniref:DsrE family protein n=1 Tax=Micrococcaceae TaxID=1268 RepID=UPI000AA101B0|nr:MULTISPECIES: DsrE family protein [Micrococcaceae]
MVTTIPETEQAGPGLLIHSVGPLEQEALTVILRSAANARAALGQGAHIEVVVQGPGVKLLTTNTPAAEAMTNAGQLHVDILACGNSMRSAGMEDKDLAPGVGTVPAAIAHLARRQWDGWAYVRL